MLTLIFDLDNTIYPVSSIAEELFPPLFRILEKPEYQMSPDILFKAKQEIMRRPFQKVADEFGFPQQMVRESLEVLRTMKFEGPMRPFDDYLTLKDIPACRFLVTTGFYQLQMSKVKQLQIEQDFEKIFISDPDQGNTTKKDIFEDIRAHHAPDPEKIIVIGDDPESEIKAANELGIQTFLLDTNGAFGNVNSTFRANRLAELPVFLETLGLLKNLPTEKS